MLGKNEPLGGVKSPIKVSLKSTPVGRSALRQVEDEVKTAKQNIEQIIGGVGGLGKNIKGGVENFLGALGFKPREDGRSGLGLSEKEKKEAKRIGVSEYQWATNSAGNAITSSNIRRSKKKIGALGDEITEYDIFSDEVVKSKWDPEAKEGKGAYVRIDDEITEGDEEIDVAEGEGEEIITEEGESIEGGVTDPISLENLKIENKTNDDVGGFEKEDKIAIQTEMINSGADLSYTVDNKKVEGLDAADGNWGPRSQQAYQWYLDGNDLKDFVYKPVKKSKTKIETQPTDYASYSFDNAPVTSLPSPDLEKWNEDFMEYSESVNITLALEHSNQFKAINKYYNIDLSGIELYDWKLEEIMKKANLSPGENQTVKFDETDATVYSAEGAFTITGDIGSDGNFIEDKPVTIKWTSGKNKGATFTGFFDDGRMTRGTFQKGDFRYTGRWSGYNNGKGTPNIPNIMKNIK